MRASMLRSTLSGRWVPLWLTLLFLLLAATIPLKSVGNPGAGEDPSYRPGADDPVTNPSRYYFFPDDELLASVVVGAAESSTLHSNWNGPVQPDSISSWQPEVSQTSQQPGLDTKITNSSLIPSAMASGRVLDPSKADDTVLAYYTVDEATPRVGYTVVLNPDTPGAVRKTFSPGANRATDTYFLHIDVAVADVDRAGDENGVFHDEIVVASRTAAADGSWQLTVTVLDRQLNEVASATSGVPLPAGEVVWTTFALTTGDFNNDGRSEICVVQDACTPGANRQNAVTTFALVDATLQKRDTLITAGVGGLGPLFQAVPGKYDIVAGDFDGNGTDEIALSSAVNSNYAAILQVLSTDADCTLALRSSTSTPLGADYVPLVTGLFHYDPNKGYSTARKQLATAIANGLDEPVKVTLYDLDSTMKLVARGTADVVSPQEYVDSLIGRPHLVAGSFLGLEAPNPHDDLAVSFVSYSIYQPAPPTVAPKFGVLQVNDDMTLSLQGIWYFDGTPSDATNHSTVNIESDAMVDLALLAADRTGDGFYLGAPVHIEMDQDIRTDYVIQEPPKHIDYLPNERGEWEQVNVSRKADFYAELSDDQEATLKTTQKDETDVDYGQDSSQTASETLKIGGRIKKIAAGFEQDFKYVNKTTYDFESVTSLDTDHYVSQQFSYEDRTAEDDFVRANVKVLDIWRYPVYGATDGTNQGYYEVVMPGPSQVLKEGPGTGLEWYQPVQENGNILSYPALSDTNVMPDQGTFLYNGQEFTEPLSENAEIVLGGTEINKTLKWTNETGQSSEVSYKTTSTNSQDVKVGVKAKGHYKVVEAELGLDLDWSWHESDSTSTSSTSTNTNSQTRGITVHALAGMDANRMYSFKPIVYITQDGTFKLAHTVDPLGSAQGAAWWLKTYAGRPDPALNLPTKFLYEERFQYWQPNETRQDRTRMRGLFLMKQYAATEDQREYLATAPVAGEKICVLARLNNYSLDTNTGPFNVRFSYMKFNPALGDEDPEPHLTDIGTFRIDNVAPRQPAEAWVTWDTTGLGGTTPGTSQSYVLYVTLDPDHEVADQIHGINDPDGDLGGNDQGYYPWDNSLRIFSPAPEPPARGGEAQALKSRVAANNVSVAPGLRLFHRRAGFFTRAVPQNNFLILAGIHSDRADRSHRFVSCRVDGKLISSKTAHGLDAGMNYFYFPWRPTDTEGHQVTVRVEEGLDDGNPGDNEVTEEILAASTASGSLGELGSPGFCFVATAAYGSYQEPHVQVLKQFRDRCLATNAPGRLATELYYRLSPPLARFIAARPWAQSAARVVLLPAYAVAWLGLRGLLWLVPTAVLAVLLGAARRRRQRAR